VRQLRFEFSIEENAGRRGGPSTRVDDPTPEEIEELKARILKSRTDPELRDRLRLPPWKPTPRDHAWTNWITTSTATRSRNFELTTA
jgi:hypothetical protein